CRDWFPAALFLDFLALRIHFCRYQESQSMAENGSHWSLRNLLFCASGRCPVIVPIVCVVTLSTFVLAGCTPGVTDVAAFTRPGRIEASSLGFGVPLGGILFRPDSAAKPLGAIIVLHGWAEEAVPGA